MLKKMRIHQAFMTIFLTVLLLIGLAIKGPVRQTRPEINFLSPTTLLILATLVMLLIIFTGYPIRYFDTYISKIIRQENLTVSDLARLTSLENSVFRQSRDRTVRTKTKYQKQVAVALEKRFDINHH